MTQHLTLTEVQAAAAKAYAEGRLTAQNPIRTLRKCVYTDHEDRGCAIGVALAPETLKAIQTQDYSWSRVQALLSAKIISAPPAEHSDILTIQRRHDRWCSLASYENPGEGTLEETECARVDFLASIGVEKTAA